MRNFISKKEKVLLYSVFGTFILIVFLNFVILPILNQNAALDKDINITQIKLNKYASLLRNKLDIQNKYSQVFGRFTGKAMVLNKADGVLSSLDSLAKNSDIRIVDMRPQGASISKELVIDFKAEGEMQNYLKFLYNFEGAFPWLRIKRFQLSAKANTQFLEGSFTISQPLITE